MNLSEIIKDMKTKTSKKQPAAVDDGPDLLGLDLEILVMVPLTPEPVKGCTGWWIRTSAKQVLNAAGRPVGFKHHLMHGRKVMMSGTGADAARTFAAQVAFLNQVAHASDHNLFNNGANVSIGSTP
jgi:hypothetical protein